LTEEDLTHPDRAVQLGVAPWRINILTRIDGLIWDEANVAAEMTTWTPPSAVIGRRARITNKRASGSDEDHADIARLDAGEDPS